jgi:hypothetical protein
MDRGGAFGSKGRRPTLSEHTEIRHLPTPNVTQTRPQAARLLAELRANRRQGCRPHRGPPGRPLERTPAFHTGVTTPSRIDCTPLVRHASRAYAL